MVIKCPAKINLALKVEGIRETDGYHLLRMVNLPLELHDVIEIESLPYFNDTYVTCDDMRLVGLRSNLCTDAVKAMRNAYGFKNNFTIRIHKEIPSAAGLGGGSSDAAGTMLGLNHLLKLGKSLEELCALALPLGSDIPFFLHGQPALAEGIGGDLTPILPKRSYYCLLVKPEQGLSTKDVYLNQELSARQNIDIDGVIEGLEAGDEDQIAQCFGNDLFPPAAKLLPEVANIVNILRNDGFPLAAMSGSGSCCFALSLDQKKIKAEEKKMRGKGYEVILTKTLK